MAVRAVTLRTCTSFVDVCYGEPYGTGLSCSALRAIATLHVHTPHRCWALPLQVYYNNLLSVPLILAAMVYFGELQGLAQQPALGNPMFQGVALLGGLLGFAIRCGARGINTGRSMLPGGVGPG